MDDNERYITIIWCIIVTIASVIGDTLILVGTIKYNAIKQSKLIVAVIQHLAICDLLQTVFRVIPDIPAYISDYWILGRFLCHVNAMIGKSTAILTMILTSCMSTIKLVTLKRPLRTGTWKKRVGHMICGAAWFLVLCLPMYEVFFRNFAGIDFSTRDYACGSGGSKTANFAYLASTILSSIIMIVTSIMILITAKKSASARGGTVRWEGIITVLITVLVLLVSYIPHSVFVGYLIIYLLFNSDTAPSFTTMRMMNKVQYLNIMANFFVYCFTVTSFRGFLKNKGFELLSTVRRCCGHRTPLPQRRRLNPGPAQHEETPV